MKQHRCSIVTVVVVASVFSLGLLQGGASTSADTGESATAAPPTSIPELEGLEGLDIPVLLKANELEIGKVFEMIAATGGIEVRVEGPKDWPVTVSLAEPVPLRAVLEQLAEAHQLSYEVSDPRTLVVRVPWLAGEREVTVPRVRSESKVAPVYPEQARAARVDGSVFLTALIRRDGSVGSVDVLREDPSGYGFAESAVRAARQWRYEPATLDGQPVDVRFVITVDFEVDDTPGAVRRATSR
jgi:TonB family protein